MSIFSRAESKVEKSINGAFARVFKSSLKGVDLTAAINRAMDDGSQEFEVGRIVAPNDFSIRLSPEDYTRFEKAGIEVVASEVAQAALDHAQSEQYILSGSVVVSISEDETLQVGQIETDAQTQAAGAAPAFDMKASAQAPIVEIGGRMWRLVKETTVLGRGQDCDIVIDDSSVSRRHAEIRITPGAYLLTDLSSTNGTFVEGHKITACQLVDGNEVTLGRTSFMFWTEAQS